MPVPFIMPKFDMDQEKATILSWTKQEGDSVKFEEETLVVETDKIAIEVPAPAAGRLAGIRYKAGDVVPVTEVIAYILKEGETLADLPGSDLPASQPAVPQPPPLPIQAEPVQASPVAARMAKEAGLDIKDIPASGAKVMRQDVERYLADRGSLRRTTAPATPAARRLAREMNIPIEAVAGTGPLGRVQAADVTAAGRTAALPLPGGRPAEVIELTGIRQTIADRMQHSFQTIPHIALTVEVDVTELEKTRAYMNAQAEGGAEAKISLTALVVKVTAWALERNPWLNASLLDGKIHLWKNVNIGVATAIDGGLIVPVVHDANRKSVKEMAAALQDLTTRARQGRLELQDVQHGTLTISNLGMYGVHQFRAVINPPECAILAVGAVVRKPVVINAQDDVAVRPMMTLTLSADHRVVDGVAAARFLQDLVQAVQTPGILLY